VRRSRRSLARMLALPAVAAGVTSAAVFAASPAFAQTVTDTGGTAAVTEPFSYIAQLAKAGVAEVPLPPATVTVDKSAQTVTATFPVTGGNADTGTLSGALDVGGTLKVVSLQGKHLYTVTLTDIQVSIDAQAILATPEGKKNPVALLDFGGNIVVTQGTDQSLTASELTVDPAGATYLDKALHTTAFQSGADAGSLDAAWTTSTSS
jgi:hypothetical protein